MSVATVPTPVTKPWYQSKIVWAGVVATLLGVIPLVQQSLPTLMTANPVDFWTAILTVITGIFTVIARIWFTDTPVS